MHFEDRIERFHAQISVALWPEPLWHAVLEFFGTEDIARVSYHHIPPLGAPDEGRTRVIAEGYPDAYLEDYIRSKAFRTDPIVLHALTEERPFPWRDVPKFRKLTTEEKSFFKRLCEDGYDNGIGISVFGPGGRTGFFGLGLAPEDPVPPRDVLLVYAWVCQHAHLTYCKMVRKQLPDVPQLTARETEILRWVARGKSNSVIADIMSLSPHTVDAHIRRIFLKLGTTDRVSAAVRGIGEGLLQGR